MKQQQIEYTCTNPYIRGEYTTMAVSEADAINNIFYRLWFGERVWTKHTDWTATPSVLLRFKKYDNRRDKRTGEDAGIDAELRDRNKAQYVQMSLPF